MTETIRPTSRAAQAKAIANLLIYGSVILGMVLLIQLYSNVPPWLFLSVIAGWLAYLSVAIAISRGVSGAYPISMLLAFLTLGVSLPQPEHASLVQSGFSLASLTFIAGSALQVGVIVAVVSYLVLVRRDRRESHQ